MATAEEYKRARKVGKKIMKRKPQWMVRSIIPYGGKFILVVKGGKAYVSTVAYKGITPIKEVPPFRTVADAKRSISNSK